VRPARGHIVIVTCAAAALVAVVSLCLVAGGCGSDDASRAEARKVAQARTLEQVRRTFAAAASAVLRGDAGSPAEWAPPSGPVRHDLDAVFRTLASLPWSSFAFEVTPLDPDRGLYRLRGAGRLGSAGPDDRVAVVRYLTLEPAGADVRVVADGTPPDLRRRYLMALHDPVVLQRPGLLVLGDGRAQDRVAAVAAAAAKARPRLDALGADTRPTVVVTVFGSAEDARDALGIGASATRLTFFAYPALRPVDEPWPIRDVGVIGPWLRGMEGSMGAVLTHELAHAYTVRWFADTERAPGLLVEGIAQAAEGVAPLYLRDEVTTGGQLWPLPESFATEDLWEGNDGQAVRLGYEIGGSLVDYVISRWGAGKLRPFVQAVADADPTEAGLDVALGATLGVTWRQFHDGWGDYVLRQR
jgi:hypothetical protein